MTREEMISSLEAISDICDEVFSVTNPGRLDQLRSAIDTAVMAVQYLYTETPYAQN